MYSFKVVKVAEKYKNYSFAVASEDEFERDLTDAGLGDSGLEINVIAFDENNRKYPMLESEFDGEFEENFSSFMEKFISGQIKPHLKSQPIPKENKDAVMTLVANNFYETLDDDSKDILVEFYAPWCGHCQAFAPKYERMAMKLKKEQPNLILAKYDAINNELPYKYDVGGFPTFYFIPSGKRDSPIQYEGLRDEESIMKFIEKNARKSFKIKKEEL
ncbi:hypothetical protein AB6A40_007328 [Gnathostoma spinigerum]|uniref:Thioredoxin domain-containing protein n=1 Tax=Gnathostoma spinigerum TaxID=75299 RepID=A0ABD6ER22_9BILA